MESEKPGGKGLRFHSVRCSSRRINLRPYSLYPRKSLLIMVSSSVYLRKAIPRVSCSSSISMLCYSWHSFKLPLRPCRESNSLLLVNLLPLTYLDRLLVELFELERLEWSVLWLLDRLGLLIEGLVWRVPSLASEFFFIIF